MAKRKTVWQVVRNDSSMRSLRSTVGSFETIGEAREFLKAELDRRETTEEKENAADSS